MWQQLLIAGTLIPTFVALAALVFGVVWFLTAKDDEPASPGETREHPGSPAKIL